MENSVKERIKIFIKSKELTQKAFEQACKLSNGYVNNIRVSISDAVLQRIALSYPDLNPIWVKMGVGEMLLINDRQERVGEQSLKELGQNTDKSVTMPKEVFELIKKQSDTILSQQKTLEYLAQLQNALDRLPEMKKLLDELSDFNKAAKSA